MAVFTTIKDNNKILIIVALCSMFLNIYAIPKWQYVGALHGRTVNAIKYIDVNTSVIVGGIQNTNMTSVYVSQGVDLYTYSDFDTTQLKFTDVSFPLNDIGYTVGWNGAILKTINRGDSWYYLKRYLPLSVVNKDFNGVFFLNENTGYVVGGKDDTIQTILKTTNGGDTWSIQRNIPGHWLTSVYFISNTTGVAVGKTGTVLKTTDGGITWNTITVSGNAGTRNFNKIIFKNATTGFIVGGSEADTIQTILKSIDAGNTWSVILDTKGEQMLNAICFKDAANGFAVGNRGVIKATINGGDNWTPFILPDTINDSIRDLYAVNFFNNYSGAFGGLDGKYFVYTDSLPPAPSAVTNNATVNADKTVLLTGAVNANAGKTHATFEYGLTQSFGSSINVLPDSISGNTFQNVSVTTPILSDGKYYYRVRASSPSGDSTGETKQFSVGVPTVRTGGVLIDPSNKVKLSGIVNSYGGSSNVVFEYGLTTALENVISLSANPVVGNTDKEVFVISPILTTGIYYYRIVATSLAGSDTGKILQFYIGPNPIPNFDFEFWKTDTFNTPKFWLSQSIHKGISYDGSTSVILDGFQNKDGFGILLMGNIDGSNNGPGGGAPFNARPDSVVGYFKYSLAPHVPAFLGVIFKKDGNYLSMHPFHIGDSTHYNSNGQFERLAFPFSYTDSIVPDSVIIIILSCDALTLNLSDPNNVLEVDNISFIGTTQNVPNPGFEEWTQILTEYPTFWNTLDRQEPYNFPKQVIKTTDAQNGNYAVKLQNNLSLLSPARMETERLNNDGARPSFSVSQKFTVLNGYYKFYRQNDDTAFIHIDMYKNGEIIGNGIVKFTENDTIYRPFKDSISYYTPDIPDSAAIYVYGIDDYYGSVHGNSILYVDNLSFDGFHKDTLVATGINSNIVLAHTLRIYPNPANNYLAVELPKNEKILSVTIFDLKGNAIYSETIANAYKDVQMFNVSDFNSGMFIIIIQTENTIYSNKFIISR